MTKETILKIISTLIAMMFFYAALVKLIDLDKAYRGMRNQIFSNDIADILTWLIPVIELLIVLLLIYTPTRRKGFYVSFGLLSVFTLYITLLLTRIFGDIPCNCGGILNNLPYTWHIAFNLFFMLLAGIGFTLERRVNKSLLNETNGINLN